MARIGESDFGFQGLVAMSRDCGLFSVSLVYLYARLLEGIFGEISTVRVKCTKCI